MAKTATTTKKKKKRNRDQLLAMKDPRALTNDAADLTLKRLGLTIQDLIDREQGMSGISGSGTRFGPVKLLRDRE